MKMEKLLIGLMAAGMLAFVSCNYAGNSSGGSGNNSIPPKDKLTIGTTTYENTAEVQLMTKAATVEGSDDYTVSLGEGAFPKGRTVTISPFIMGKYEVTQELYQAVMTGQKVTAGSEQKALSANPSNCILTSEEYKNMLSGEEQKYRPVERVTWYDAVYFCNALSEKLGLIKAYNITVETVSSNGNITKATVTPVKGANGYRLPTEAEWEYAARGGEKGVADNTFANYFSGADTTNYSAKQNADLDKAGWYKFNIKTGKTDSTEPCSGDAGYGTHQVGKKSPNEAGFCDMSGNVNEWCYDWYDNIDTSETVTDPSGPSEAQFYRIVRGGGWDFIGFTCAVSYRNYADPAGLGDNLGFRVVRNVQ